MIYDVLVLGGGPGGYIAAERAGDLGMKVLLIEKDELGGVCLNRGCIPTKTLLNSAKYFAHCADAGRFGVQVTGLKFDLPKAMAWKNEVVEKLRGGVAHTLKRSGVTVVKGTGEIISKNLLALKESGERFEWRNLIIAAGSSPAVIPVPGAVLGAASTVRGEKFSGGNPLVLDSTGILDIKELPEKLTIIGGGVIGIEFASLFHSLGVKVAVVEMLDEILPFMDSEIAQTVRKALKGIDFHLSCRVTGIEGGRVSFTSAGGEKNSIDGDLVLMAVGRKPNLEGYGLESLNLDTGRSGIVVDDWMRTSLPGVYGVGDVNGRSLLAHSASRMGEIAVEDIALRKKADTSGTGTGFPPAGGAAGSSRFRGDAVPWVVYSLPETAGVGLTGDEAARRGIETVTAALPMGMNGRFAAENGFAAPGICKVIADPESGVLLGVHLVGSCASEMIWGAGAMIEAELRIGDIKDIVFPHPTVSEIIRDTVLKMK